MSMNPGTPPEVETAHVLFMDLVGFSRLAMNEQTRLVQLFQQKVLETPAFQRAVSAGELIRLPTGDGMALVFFGDPQAPALCALEVTRSAREVTEMHLRMGINTGPVQRHQDINGNVNVTGSGINLAQRVMDCGDTGHVLVSHVTASLLHQMGEWSEFLRDLGEVEIKHGQRLHLHNLFREGAGNRETPSRIRNGSQSPGSPPQVAMLYKRNAEPDEQLMRRLEAGFAASGFQVFIDRHLTIGVDWAMEIDRKIKTADVVVPLLSAASVQSDTFIYEIERAHAAGIRQKGKPRLLPVRVNYEGPLPPAIARLLDPLEYSLWQGPQDDARVVEALSAATRTFAAENRVKEERATSSRPSKHLSWVWPAIATACLALLATVVFRDHLPAALGGKSIPAEKQLVVLPFKNIGSNANNVAFTEGLTETITAQLTQMQQAQPTLLVVPMSEVRREQVVTAKTARSMFGATLVLDGSVQRLENAVRVTVNLVDARTLRILLSATIDASTNEVYRLQDSVAARTASWLGVELSPELKRTLAAGQTHTASAYELYLKGMGRKARFDLKDNLDLAIEDFLEALIQDSSYALAHAALGETYRLKYARTKNRDYVAKAAKSSATALELDPDIPAAHITRGVIETAGGHYETAVEEFQLVLSHQPFNSDALRELARAYKRLNRPSEAEQAFKRAIQWNTNNWLAYAELGKFYWDTGRTREAEAAYIRVKELTPDNYLPYRNLGGMYDANGRYADAVLMLEKSMSLRRTGPAASNLGIAYYYQRQYEKAAQLFEEATVLEAPSQILWGNLGDALRHVPGQDARARTMYQKAIELCERDLEENPNSAEAHASLALHLVGIGDKDRAIQHIQRAVSLAPLNVPVLYNAGVVFERTGMRNDALNMLATALEKGQPENEILVDPDLKELIQSKEFDKLLSARRKTDGVSHK